MMHYTTALALSRARLADLHDQARRDALARAARRRYATRRTPGLLAAFARWVRRPAPAQGSL